MNAEQDMLEAVVAEVNRRKGEWRQIARDLGISYDTLRRVAAQENDNRYSLVRTLHDYLFQRQAA
jgi:uncharacterized protein YdbL (DUF1318 family)